MRLTFAAQFTMRHGFRYTPTRRYWRCGACGMFPRLHVGDEDNIGCVSCQNRWQTLPPNRVTRNFSDHPQRQPNVREARLHPGKNDNVAYCLDLDRIQNWIISPHNAAVFGWFAVLDAKVPAYWPRQTTRTKRITGCDRIRSHPKNPSSALDVSIPRPSISYQLLTRVVGELFLDATK